MNKRTIRLIPLLVCGLFLLSARPPRHYGPVSFEHLDLIEQLKFESYNHTLDISEIVIIYNRTMSEIEVKVADEREKNYLFGMASFFLAKSYIQGYGENYKILIKATEFSPMKNYEKMEKLAEADRHFSEAVAYAENSMADSRYSEGMRLHSEANGQLCVIRGLGYTLANGLDVLGSSNRSRRLDETNIKAMILEASAKAYPPSAYFGNARKALRLLDRIPVNENSDPEDLFNIYLAYGLCFAKRDRIDESVEMLEKALVIYPGNKFGKGLIGMIQRREFPER